MTVARELGERGVEVLPLHLLAAVTRMEGDYEGARRLYLESIALNNDLGDRRMVAMEHINLGSVEVLAGNPDDAKPHLREGLRTAREQRDKGFISSCLIGLASVAQSQGDSSRAARLLGAVKSELDATGTALDPDDQPMYEAAVERASVALGKEAFAAQQELGRMMTLEEAAAYALDETT